MIKTIALDFGGVLAYPVSGNWFIPYNLFKIVGFKNSVKLMIKKNRLNDAFKKANVYLNENHLLFTEDEEYEQFKHFYKTVFNELKMKVTDSIIDRISQEIVYNDYKMKLYDDVSDIIKRLKLTYRVVIISDTWPSLRRFLKNNGILELLDGIIMSCNYNKTKETTELFEIAVRECNLKPDECIFVDDSAGNLKNAEKTGFKPILMDRGNTKENAEFPVIHSLDELKNFIEISDACAEQT